MTTCICKKEVGPDHRLVAAYGGWCCPDRLKKARTLASAPPTTQEELLRELKRCEQLLSSITNIDSNLAEFQDAILRSTRAAIARAENES